MREDKKIRRITRELFHGQIDRDKFPRLIRQGFRVHHTPGTAFVDLKHPSGGDSSLLEVCTYGSQMTTGEADEVARVVAKFLDRYYSIEEQETETPQESPDAQESPVQRVGFFRSLVSIVFRQSDNSRI